MKYTFQKIHFNKHDIIINKNKFTKSLLEQIRDAEVGYICAKRKFEDYVTSKFSPFFKTLKDGDVFSVHYACQINYVFDANCYAHRNLDRLTTKIELERGKVFKVLEQRRDSLQNRYLKYQVLLGYLISEYVVEKYFKLNYKQTGKTIPPYIQFSVNTRNYLFETNHYKKYGQFKIIFDVPFEEI
jgi:hypothetical protein